MKLCPKCNYSNQDFDTVCNSCGSSLETVNEPNAYGMNAQDTNNYGMNNPPMPVMTNGMAIASMVLGIVSVPLGCCWGIGVIPAILAIIFGFLAKSKIRSSSGTQKGSGMALAGIILGFAAIAIIIVLVVVVVAGGGLEKFMDEYQRQMNLIKNNSISQ